MVIMRVRIEVATKQKIMLPEDATILSVMMKDDGPVIYAMANPSNPMRARQIGIYGTDNLIGEEVGRFINSFERLDGWYTWHAFELADSNDDDSHGTSHQQPAITKTVKTAKKKK